MKLHYLLLPILAASLTACVDSQIKQTGSGIYTINTSTTDEGSNSIRDAVNNAAVFCAKKDLRLVMIDLNSNYLAVNAPKDYNYKANIKFQCYPQLINAIEPKK